MCGSVGFGSDGQKLAEEITEQSDGQIGSDGNSQLAKSKLMSGPPRISRSPLATEYELYAEGFELA